MEVSSFLTGLAAAVVLTALTIVVYDFSQVTVLENLSLPSVHIGASD
jgi:hypothetical protein